jgi:acid phosphatase family membrane protein YuiD
MNFGRLFNGTGGMPSSHTSFSSSVTMLVGCNLGFDSPVFAVSLIFMMITAYDAMGLRFESGKQAEAINLLFDEMGKIKKPKYVFKRLKESLGHKPLEVLVGLILGTTVSLCFYAFV